MSQQYNEKVCVCGDPESRHAKTEPRVCNSLACGCWQFQERWITPTNYSKYLNQIPATKDKIAYLLENIQPLRNEDNQFFVLDYMIFTVGTQDKIILSLLKSLRSRIKYLTRQKKLFIEDWETVRRAKQYLVEHEPDKYAPYDPKATKEKELKQTAFEEFLLMGVSEWE